MPVYKLFYMLVWLIELIVQQICNDSQWINFNTKTYTTFMNDY